MGNIRKKGNSFEVRYQAQGRRCSKTFKTKKQAEAFLTTLKHETLVRGAPIHLKAKDFTLGGVVTEYLGLEGLPKGKVYCLRSVLRDLENIDFDPLLVELSKDKFLKYLQGKKEFVWDEKIERKNANKLYRPASERTERKPATMRKYYYAIKTALHWHADLHGYELPVFKTFDAKRAGLAAWDERDRRLSPSEEKALMEATGRMRRHGDAMARLIRFALLTGMRQAEILLMTPSDILRGGRSVNIPKANSKTRAERQVPLRAEAKFILDEQMKSMPTGESRIFYQWHPGKSCLVQTFKRLTHNADLLDLRFHDLRHEAISRLFEEGKLNVMEIAKMVGHRDLRTLERYTKLFADNLAEKLDR